MGFELASEAGADGKELWQLVLTDGLPHTLHLPTIIALRHALPCLIQHVTHAHISFSKFCSPAHAELYDPAAAILKQPRQDVPPPKQSNVVRWKP
jgi:hypothetical protein